MGRDRNEAVARIYCLKTYKSSSRVMHGIAYIVCMIENYNTITLIVRQSIIEVCS